MTNTVAPASKGFNNTWSSSTRLIPADGAVVHWMRGSDNASASVLDVGGNSGIVHSPMLEDNGSHAGVELVLFAIGV